MNLNPLPSTLKIIALALVFSTTGCSVTHAGASHRPIIDGPIDARYETDLSQCQTYAKKRSYLNDENQQDALIGGVIGGALGSGSLSSAVAGAAVGSVLSVSTSMLDTRTERKNIVISCMAQRGYKTLETTGIHN